MSKPIEQHSMRVSPHSGTPPPIHTRFGEPGGNRPNRGGVPKRFYEIRTEIMNLLDPNLTLKDYKEIYKSAEDKSGLRALFAEAIINKDMKSVFEMINQAFGKSQQRIDITSDNKPIATGATELADTMQKILNETNTETTQSS